MPQDGVGTDHPDELPAAIGTIKAGPKTDDSELISAMDRAVPTWAVIIGSIFALGIYGFLASLAVFTVFFHSSVVAEGSWIVAPLLVLVGSIPVVGILVFEFAYSRTLAGFRYIRGPAARRVQAGAGMLTLFTMTLVHPLAGVACLISVALGGALLLGLSRIRRFEGFWDFVPAEAASVLAGRDRTGMKMATTRVREHALASPTVLSFTGLALLLGFGGASYLTTTEVIDPSAVTAIALLNALATHAILGFVRDGMKTPAMEKRRTSRVEGVILDDEFDEDTGLVIKNLTITPDADAALLSDVSFSMPPGSVLGIDGESGAGKSLLLSAMADPFSFEDVEVRGRVRMNGEDLWLRHGEHRNIPAVHVSDDPILLPASGSENLSCFLDGYFLDQAKRNLERLVFSHELVDEICQAKDATKLPGMQRKALSLARAFTLAPMLYLLDRPEDGLPEKQISALLARLQEESRFGRCVVMITQNRALLEACDKIMVLQSGRIVDFGTAEDIRNRKAAGWARFVAERNLDVEENLENWVRSHFKRPGDEANRRKVAHIASELLAFSCQGAGGALVNKTVIFEFKHFIGHCILRLQDGDAPVTSSTLQKAELESNTPQQGKRLSPLGSIIQNCSEIEAGADLDRRVLSVKIETFDPRKVAQRGVETTTD